MPCTASATTVQSIQSNFSSVLGSGAHFRRLKISSSTSRLLRTMAKHDILLPLKDVPSDAFWDISVYNSDLYFQKNKYNAYSINSKNAERNADGSVTIHFGVNLTSRTSSTLQTDGSIDFRAEYHGSPDPWVNARFSASNNLMLLTALFTSKTGNVADRM